ncbi:UNVERIFIED_CONTAM: hypothetical protein FKN15_007501 [Acipenser sinensis]
MCDGRKAGSKCDGRTEALGEPLYRVATGNYEYRLVLRCRQEVQARFAKMRKDVLEKIELLDQKHGETADTGNQPITQVYSDMAKGAVILS